VPHFPPGLLDRLDERVRCQALGRGAAAPGLRLRLRDEDHHGAVVEPPERVGDLRDLLLLPVLDPVGNYPPHADSECEKPELVRDGLRRRLVVAEHEQLRRVVLGDPLADPLPARVEHHVVVAVDQVGALDLSHEPSLVSARS
jgi:hypothetical protein